MDNQSSELDNHLNDSADITLSIDGKKDFRTMANWCIFFSILGFLFSAMMLIGGLAMSSVLGGMAGMGGYTSALTYLYIFMGFVYALPVYFLFKFATKMKGALTRNNSIDFNDAINKLKTHFAIMGVMTIIMVVVYIIFIFAIVGGITSGMANEWAL